jgi:hypothetical protein
MVTRAGLSNGGGPVPSGRASGRSLIDTQDSHETVLVQEIENYPRGLGRRDTRDDAGHEFSIVYEKTKDNQLIASSFSGRNNQDEKPKVSFPRFLALAWTAANEKAKELGWIVSRDSR